MVHVVGATDHSQLVSENYAPFGGLVSIFRKKRDLHLVQHNVIGSWRRLSPMKGLSPPSKAAFDDGFAWLPRQRRRLPHISD